MKMMSKTQTRRLLLWGVPAISVIAAALYWQYGGKVITTDNAYAKADLIALYPEVEASVREVRVVENARVEAGQPLVVLDADAIRIEIDRSKAEAERIREEILRYTASYVSQKPNLDWLRNVTLLPHENCLANAN